MSKEDEDHYAKDAALLRRLTIREQGRVPPEDITYEEGISSSKSDPEPDLNEEIGIREHTTRSGRITSVKLPAGLQRTQIRKVL